VAARTPPSVRTLLSAHASNQPTAIVLAGHNGSGKSTLWYDRLADDLKLPLLNADRLTISFLPPLALGETRKPWANQLRDEDHRWQKLSQQGVQELMRLAMEQTLDFAFETVFSYLAVQPDGSVNSKTDLIRLLQERGYFVILLFVGLTSADLSIFRVSTRTQQGQHGVPEIKLRERFPRTQQAIRIASQVADLTLMFDNSRGVKEAFTLVRAQRGKEALYDCRDPNFKQDAELVRAASLWLAKVAPQ
jgi:predicted ABC-type ATPase